VAVQNKNIIEHVVEEMETPSKVTIPIDDPRYPQYASMMADGRLATDYTSHCSKNIGQPKDGNGIRNFLQHNADALIQTSRKRQADRAGAQFEKAMTVMGPREYQRCSEYACTTTVSDFNESLGIARTEPVPELFGTFSEPDKRIPGYKNIQLTTVYEGGRNTRRGQDFVPLGNTSFNPRKSVYGSSG
jgi:hypothetical protein